MNTKNPQHIAILRLGALGDCCMTIPLALALRDHFPNTQIHWIIDRSFAPLINDIPGIQFIPIQKPRSLKQWRTCQQQLSRCPHLDILLMPQASLRSNLISLFLKAETRIGYDKLHAKDFQSLFTNQTVPAQKEHLVDAFLQFASALHISTPHPRWELPIPTADIDYANRIAPRTERPLIAVCPSTSKIERNWPVAKYSELIQILQHRYNAQILLLAGPDNAAQEIAKQISDQTENVIQPPPGTLKQLAALLQQSDLLISPDTGQAHIADAVSTPVIGLYAVMTAAKTGPYRSRELCVDKYREAITQIAQKDPDQVSWNFRVHDARAMALITVDDVLERCAQVL